MQLILKVRVRMGLALDDARDLSTVNAKPYLNLYRTWKTLVLSIGK
jgi:hypothetical protein